ncbi:DoxX family protein [Robiginitalea sp. SC105]|uniref:DoxX family protein n=1 Tax=Robiginitalea sp. SC105 TaxID=2762332 RepID=UPI00163AFDA6|nr:DoxX family protein [Robiginitalea sp. SC105]MBC2838157.1 DoxX family protein [Robiginitalea sp. SC105]
MNLIQSFERFYLQIKGNRWYWLFSIFCRLALAYAFIVAGMVKIVGERFASGLSDIHPMGAYLEALHHTGYYYTFIGIAQVVAAVLLLIPRTVTLGALLYFPIIVNIWLLSFAVRFEGSLVTSPLMVLANLYLLIWNYDRLRYILPFRQFPDLGIIRKPAKYSTKFPFLFFSGVVITVALTISFARYGYDVMPRNSLSDCKKQFENTGNEAVGIKFCECIHKDGQPLNECLKEFENSKE